jgi:hypothetical protein
LNWSSMIFWMVRGDVFMAPPLLKSSPYNCINSPMKDNTDHPLFDSDHVGKICIEPPSVK